MDFTNISEKASYCLIQCAYLFKKDVRDKLICVYKKGKLFRGVDVKESRFHWMSDAINTFDWSKSEEGHGYWEEICENPFPYLKYNKKFV